MGDGGVGIVGLNIVLLDTFASISSDWADMVGGLRYAALDALAPAGD